jgi:NAD(P)-dependent dehydrogenase (short-subunit alcohol dehydrogenase family)
LNNAGVLVSRPPFEITADDMKDTYDTNVFGVVRMMPVPQRVAAF